MAGPWNFAVTQGESFDEPIGVTLGGVPMDFTGYTAVMQVRDRQGNLLIELSTANERLVLTTGVITPNVLPADTAALPRGSHFYDLFLYQGAAYALQLLTGTFTVNPAVTHA